MTNDPNPFASPTAVAVPLPSERPLSTEFPAEMRRVRTGLTLVYYGICGMLLSAIAMPFVMGMAMRGADANAAAMFMLVFGLVFLGMGIMMFIGQVLCIAAPQESGAKGLVLAAVALQALNLLGALVIGVTAAGAENGVVQGISNLLGVAAMPCFVLFLRKTALYIQREDIARRAVRTIIVGAVSLLMLLVGGGAVMYSAMSGPGSNAPPNLAFVALMAIGAIAMLVALIMYANTITYLRKAITV